MANGTSSFSKYSDVSLMKPDIDKILMDTGEERSRYYESIAPPAIQSSIRAFDTVNAFRQAIQNEDGEWIYTKGSNPTVEILEKKLAALESTQSAIVVGSGTSAMTLAIMSRVKQGDHVICVKDPYSWTGAVLRGYLPRFGVSCTFVDGTETDNFRKALQANSVLMVLESPNSLTFELQDIEACVTLARKHGLSTIIDNSCATPLYQRPAEMGIDLVVHSLTKYLNGHSDVVAGCICGSDEMIRQIFFNEYMHIGPAISPHDAYLILRGLRTFAIRMGKISATAKGLVSFLKEHKRVRKVYYPYDPDFPQYDLARRQMSGGTGLITIELDAPDISSVHRFVESLDSFKLAVSWGGPESLVLPIAALYGLDGRQDPKAPWSTVRLSVGLENHDVLIADLNRALASL